MNVYIKELSSALADFPNVHIDIFTRRQSPDRKLIKLISPFLRVIQIPAGPERPQDRRDLFAYVPEFIENMVEFMLENEESYDLVYSHYWLSGLIGEWIKYRFNVPLIHTYHTLGFLKKRVLTGGEHRYRIPAEQHLARVVDIIISSSLEEKENLMREFGLSPRKPRVIFPGVNKDIFRRVEADRAKIPGSPESVLLYVGRIEPVKGLMDVVTALDSLRVRAPDLFAKLGLVVIGGGSKERDFSHNPEIVRIRASVERLNLEKKIHFLGSLPQEELRRFYSAADALVVPSLYESFGLVVVESLACGTPVLVSKIGKMQSIVKDGCTGFSFRPNDPASLAASLQYFFSHQHSLWPAERIRSDMIERFSWRQTAEMTYQVFRESTECRPVGQATTTLLRGESPPQA
jgi:D-inositol-3-phosphate glycosyltransferase